MAISDYINHAQFKYGWNDDTILAFLIEYIDNQKSDDAFEDFLAQKAGNEEEIEERQTNAQKYGLLACPDCGSGDVAFCEISRRPHCNECGRRGSANHGPDQWAIDKWNEDSRKAGRD